MKHGRMTQKLLSMLLAVVMLWSFIAETMGYAFAVDLDSAAEPETVQSNELNDEPVSEKSTAEQKETSETPDVQEDKEEQLRTVADQSETVVEPEETQPEVTEEPEETQPEVTEEPEETQPAVTQEPEDETFVIASWTWVTDDKSIADKGSVTLSKQAPAATAGGPRRVRPKNSGETFTWDDVYAVLPEQIKAQDEDGNEITVELVKEDGRVVWTYSDGKLGEGECPQSGSYVFEAQVDSATGVLADTADRLQITVYFEVVESDETGDLDNGLGTDNGLPNYGIRIIIDAPENTSYSAEKVIRFLMEANGNAGNLIVERFRWDSSREQYRLYNNRSSDSSDADQGYHHGLDENYKWTFGQLDGEGKRGYGKFVFSNNGLKHVKWDMGYSYFRSDPYYSGYTSGKEVIVVRVGTPGEWTQHAAGAMGKWTVTLTGEDDGRKLSNIQLSNGSADQDPFEVTDWSSAVDSTSPTKSAEISVPNKENKVTVVKLTYVDAAEPEPEPEPEPSGNLTLDTENGLPNYGVRIIIDGSENRAEEAEKAIRFLLNASTTSDSRLILERYRYDEELGEYRIFNNRTTTSSDAHNAYEFSLSSKISYTFGNDDEHDGRFYHSGNDKNISWDLGYGQNYKLTAADVFNNQDVRAGKCYLNGQEVIVLRAGTYAPWTQQAGIANGVWNFSISGLMDNGRKLENIQIASSTADQDPFAVTDWTDAVDSSTPNATATMKLTAVEDKITVIKLTYGDEVESSGGDDPAGSLTLNTDNGLPNYGVRIIIDATENRDRNADKALRFLLNAASESGDSLILERYRWDDSLGKYRLYNNRSSNSSEANDAYKYGLDSNRSWTFGSGDDGYDGRYLHGSSGSIRWDLGYIFNHSDTWQDNYITGKEVIVLRAGTPGEWRQHAAVANGAWSFAISGKRNDGRKLEAIEISDTTADVDPFTVTGWTDAVDTADPNKMANTAIPNTAGQVTVVKLTYGDEVEPSLVMDELGLPNYGLRIVIDDTAVTTNRNSTNLRFLLKFAGESTDGDLVFERYRYNEDTEQYERAGRYSGDLGYSSWVTDQGTTSLLDYDERSFVRRSISDVLNKGAADLYMIGECGLMSSNEVIVVRPADGNTKWDGSTNTLEGAISAELQISFNEVVTSNNWGNSLAKLISVSTASGSGDPLTITGWTALDDSGFIETDFIDIPCTAGEPTVVKLTYRDSTEGEVNDSAGYSNQDDLTDESEGVIIIRNNALDYSDEEKVSFTVTAYAPELHVNNTPNWSRFYDTQLGLMAQLYDYDPDTGVYTYNQNLIYSPWGAQPGSSINFNAFELTNNQAIVLRPTATKYAFTYTVSTSNVMIAGADLIAGANGSVEQLKYVSGNVGDQEYGAGTESPDKGQIVVLNTSKDMSVDFSRLANSSEIKGDSDKEMRFLKVNLFDYDLGFSQLLHQNNTGYNLGHNPYNANVSLQNHGVQFRFMYDSTDNGNDPAINHGHPTEQTQGIVANALNRLLDKSGNPVAYLSPAFNYTTQFDPFSLDSWSGAGYSWNNGNENITISGESKKVYANVDFEFVYNAEDGSYSYDSHKHHAQLTSDGSKIYQYSEALGLGGLYYEPTGAVSDEWGSKAAGFFPFDGPEASNFYGDKYTGIGYSNDGTTLLRREGDLDYHFGLSMQHRFTVPYDGTINGHDMVFSISGDDDIWLFVDGKLILDLGGIHEALSGEVNFTKGTYTVNGETYSLADVLNGFDSYPTAGGSSGSGGAKHLKRRAPAASNGDSSATGNWAGGTDHSFQLFYMERGGTLSDLAISFNLPSTVLKATKVWDDHDDYDGIRQDAVFQLESSTDGENFQTVDTVTIAKGATGDDLSYTWVNMPMYDSNAKKLTYRVTEQEMEGYTATTEQPSDNEFVITNTHVPVVDIDVSKQWDDGDNKDGIRPESIAFTLQRTADGKIYENVDTITVNVKDENGNLIDEADQTYTWKDQLVFDEDGNVYTYRVVEADVDGYATETSNVATEDGQYDFLAVNTHEPTPEPEPEPEPKPEPEPEPGPEPEPEPDTPSKPHKPHKHTTKKTAPKTGDESNVMLWSIMALSSMTAAAGALVLSKRSERAYNGKRRRK